ncbi:hypothetical protein BCR37DRAFT_383914 [Protomyces lactucae-debilis]|uniref:RRM domain-containing protein n=1 Tax=Protomyces lactucae-debilis TaxID=2754530 RepID=A0A1Y2EW56_PROLT|nr:uncharacterized protein BCR37DRAFT_383914 [Protomyces lactucae-debilis]ORY75780.1 hypothetical protein BCR37DRAFT_383914 [Protomyces lactucae-debilis]
MEGEQVAVVPRDARYTDITPDNTHTAVDETAQAVKKRRPARRQAEGRRAGAHGGSGGVAAPGQVYNIWYSAWSGGDREDRLASEAKAENDMGGVGSFLRQNHTLYVGRITTTNDIEEQVANAFCVWGQVERIRVLNSRGIAFVTYLHQHSAEFAKEAMAHQSLASDEVLNVRWASQDPNPQAAERDARRAEEQAAAAIRKVLPAAFLAELEGSAHGGKRKREDFGLEGYRPPDAVWFQRGQGAVNPAGRTEGSQEAKRIEVGDGQEEEVEEQSTGIVGGRALQALKQLQERKAASPVVKQPPRPAKKPALVAYDSDEE